MRHWLAFGLTCVCLLVGFSSPSVSALEDETLDVIVHLSSPVSRLTAAEIEALFTRTQTRWSDGSTVVPLSYPSGSPIRDRFDRAVMRLNPDQVARFWLDRRIRGLGVPPKQVLNAALMLKVVTNLRGSIGYAPSQRGRLGVKVVARIAQGKVTPP